MFLSLIMCIILLKIDFRLVDLHLDLVLEATLVKNLF